MKILLGISGSISSYKSFDLVRDLVKKGHELKIILTEGAEKFIKPDLFKYLGAIEVYSSQDDFNLNKYSNVSSNVLHIELTTWSDILVVAPTSANCLSRFAYGQANDLLSSVFLAYPSNKPIQIFPAMNTNMLSNPMVQKNLNSLKSMHNIFIGSTQFGVLACGELGEGKLEEITKIADLIETSPITNSSKYVLITTGATISRLDEVRYLTNPSSGKTGYELAKAFLRQGHKVHVIAGKNSTEKLKNLESHPNYILEFVVSTEDMENSVKRSINQTDIYISSAAINDIAFKQSQNKIKKEEINNTIEISKTTDILKSVLELNKKNLYVVGFAAESDISESILKTKWNRKPVNLLVGNKISSGLANNEIQGFNKDSGSYLFMSQGNIIDQKDLSKVELANYILNKATVQNDHVN